MRSTDSASRDLLVVALAGAAVTAAWFLVLDLLQGRPFFVPGFLGAMLMGDAASGPVRPAAVLVYTVVHVALFLVAGGLLTATFRAAASQPTFRMGVWLLLLISTVFAAGFGYALALNWGEFAPMWALVVGGPLGIIAMAWLLEREHHVLRPRGHPQPLGGEGGPAPVAGR